MTSITIEQIKAADAAAETAAANLAAAEAALRAAKHDAYVARNIAVDMRKRMFFQTREREFTQAAQAAISEARAIAGMPDGIDAARIRYEVPFNAYRDAAIVIQSCDYTVRARRYTMNNGKFSVKRIAAFLAECLEDYNRREARLRKTNAIQN